jgi:surfactin synthase thioesterase subunit
MKKIKLLCIPYSGGLASSYFVWKKFLPKWIEICPIELAGHGRRIQESLYRDVDEAASDIADYMCSQLCEGDPYALLGHSMGSLLAFETYHKIMESKRMPLPCHIFFLGRKAPCDLTHRTEFYKTSDEVFIKQVCSYGGVSQQFLENEELLQLFLPILRNDFMLAETHRYQKKNKKIHCNITVLNGEEDASVQTDNLHEWTTLTEGNCDFKVLPGSHFFLFEHGEMLADIIAKKLRL